MTLRRREADEFYAELQQQIVDADAKLVQRQAFAGMIWNKMFYQYSVEEWLEGDPQQPPPPAERKHGRNRDWRHLYSADVISMPDKWEFPWFAEWDLDFHCIAFAVIDSEFAKSQLLLLLARDLHAPQRPVSGLRMGIRGRQSSGASRGRPGVCSRSTANSSRNRTPPTPAISRS